MRDQILRLEKGCDALQQSLRDDFRPASLTDPIFPAAEVHKLLRGSSLFPISLIPVEKRQFLLSEPFNNPILAQKPQICPRKIGDDAHPGMDSSGPSHKYLAPMVHPLLDTR
jgi:hypothetical protein